MVDFGRRGVRVVQAIAGATVAPGELLTASGSPPKVQPASAAGTVYGIALTGGPADSKINVQTEGEVVVDAEGSASWTTHYRVVAAGSGTVDQGTTGDPFFATLLEHDATNSKARIYLHTDAAKTLSRAIIDQGDTVYPIGNLAPGAQMLVSGGEITCSTRSGVTGSRPGTTVTGQKFFDTTLHEEMVHDGTEWRSASMKRLDYFVNNSVAVGSTAAKGIGGQNSGVIPYQMGEDATLKRLHFSLLGPSGTLLVLPRIFVNGSSSWSGTVRTITTSWVTYTEDIDLDVSAGDYIEFRGIKSSGTDEAWDCTALVFYFLR